MRRLAAGIGLLALSCAAPPPPLAVRTAPVQRRDLVRDVTVPGEFAPKRYVEVRAPAGGVVKDVFAQAGDRVDEGQPLLRIETPPTTAEPSAAQPLLEQQIESARRSLETIDLAVEAQQQALERDATAAETGREAFARFEQLYKEGLLARVEYERERDKVEQLARGIEARTGEVAQLRQERSVIANRLAAAERRELVNREARAKAESTPRVRVLNAPADGYVAMIVEAGAEAGEQPVASVALSEGLMILPQDGPSAEIGAPVEIGTPDGVLPGKVGGVNGDEIELDSPPSRFFTSGVSITFPATRRQALTIPQEALHDGRWAFVVDNVNARRVEVKTGLAVDGAVEILSGLAAGQSVIVSASAELHDGDAIVVHNEKD